MTDKNVKISVIDISKNTSNIEPAREYKLDGKIFDASHVKPLKIRAAAPSIIIPPSSRRTTRPLVQPSPEELPLAPVAPAKLQIPFISSSERVPPPLSHPISRRPPQSIRIPIISVRRPVEESRSSPPPASVRQAAPSARAEGQPSRQAQEERITSRPVRLRSNTKFESLAEYKIAFSILTTNYPTLKGELPSIEGVQNLQLIDQLYHGFYRKGRRIGVIRTLKIGTLGICFLCSILSDKMLGFGDSKEFYLSQLNNVHIYEPYLEEFCEKYKLGEETEETEGEPWPLEIRFCMTIMINFTLFLGTKAVTQNSDIFGMLTKVIGGGTGASGGTVGGILGNLGGVLSTVIGFFSGGGLSNLSRLVGGGGASSSTTPLPEPTVQPALYED